MLTVFHIRNIYSLPPPFPLFSAKWKANEVSINLNFEDYWNLEVGFIYPEYFWLKCRKYWKYWGRNETPNKKSQNQPNEPKLTKPNQLSKTNKNQTDKQKPKQNLKDFLPDILSLSVNKPLDVFLEMQPFLGCSSLLRELYPGYFIISGRRVAEQ